jgi:hypothetical protein
MHATTISMHLSELKRLILDVSITDHRYLQVKESLEQENVHQKIKEYNIKEDGLLMHKNRIYVPSYGEFRNLVLNEMHNVLYVGYPSYQKIIAVVRSQLFFARMKKDVVDYIFICMECQRVKVEHIHPMGLIQPLSIPEKKWEVVTIDFIAKFPRKARKHDSIMVVVDK